MQKMHEFPTDTSEQVKKRVDRSLAIVKSMGFNIEKRKNKYHFTRVVDGVVQEASVNKSYLGPHWITLYLIPRFDEIAARHLVSKSMKYLRKVYPEAFLE